MSTSPTTVTFSTPERSATVTAVRRRLAAEGLPVDELVKATTNAQEGSKPKEIKVRLIPRADARDADQTATIYAMVDELIANYHPHLSEANIGIAWQYGVSEDRDGHCVAGKCHKASDLDFQAHGYDFIILLNFDLWTDAEFGAEWRRAVLDHELCHAAVTVDSNDDTKRDEHGRPVWRTRKHDIEEFHEVVRRHGIYRHDIETFAKSLGEKRLRPLLKEMREED